MRTAWTPLHRELVDGELARIPVTRLKGVTEQRLRAAELEKAGVRTVRDVLDAGTWTLAHFFGMERDAAEQTVAAAHRTADTVGRDVARHMGLRMDTYGPEPRTTALLAALRVLVDAGPQARSAGLAGEELAARLEPLLVTAAPAAGFREMLRTGSRERKNVLAAVDKLRLVLAEAEREGSTSSSPRPRSTCCAGRTPTRTSSPPGRTSRPGRRRRRLPASRLPRVTAHAHVRPFNSNVTQRTSHFAK
ncbi:hypothetical protein SMICM304S_12133 [Streptomyces microflavus]